MSMREDREMPHYKEYYKMIGEIAEQLKSRGVEEVKNEAESFDIKEDPKN